MALMYAASAWAAFTGLQWRRQREIGQQITSLKADMKPLSNKLEAARAAESPTGDLESRVAALQTQIDELSDTRKGLASDNLREKHYQVCWQALQFSLLQNAVSSCLQGAACGPQMRACRRYLGRFGHSWSRHRFCDRGACEHLPPRAKALPRPAFVCRSGRCRVLGNGSLAGASDAEGQRLSAHRTHRLQHPRARTLHLADPHWLGYHPEGDQVHQVPLVG